MHNLKDKFSTVDQISRILQRLLNEKNITINDSRKMINLLLKNNKLENVDSFLSAFLTGMSFLDLSSDEISYLLKLRT